MLMDSGTSVAPPERLCHSAIKFVASLPQQSTSCTRRSDVPESPEHSTSGKDTGGSEVGSQDEGSAESVS